MKEFLHCDSTFFWRHTPVERRWEVWPMHTFVETNKHARLRTNRQWRASELVVLQELPLHHVQLLKFPWLMVRREKSLWYPKRVPWILSRSVIVSCLVSSWFCLTCTSVWRRWSSDPCHVSDESRVYGVHEDQLPGHSIVGIQSNWYVCSWSWRTRCSWRRWGWWVGLWHEEKDH